MDQAEVDSKQSGITPKTVVAKKAYPPFPDRGENTVTRMTEELRKSRLTVYHKVNKITVSFFMSCRKK